MSKDGFRVLSITGKDATTFRAKFEEPAGVIGAVSHFIDPVDPPDFLSIRHSRYFGPTIWAATTNASATPVLTAPHKTMSKLSSLRGATLPFHSRGIIDTDGERWTAQRKGIVGHTKPYKIGSVISRHSKYLVEKWNNQGGAGDISHDFRLLTLGITFAGVFNYEASPQELEAVHQAKYEIEFFTRNYFRSLLRTVLGTSLYNLPYSQKFDFLRPLRSKAFKEATQNLRQIFKDVRDKVEKEDGNWVSATLKRPDIMTLSPRAAEAQINAEMNDVLATSFSTTANSLTWSLIKLGQDDQLQSELREEIRAYKQAHEDWEEHIISPRNLKELPKLNAFIQEILRFYPIPSTLPKKANEAVILDGGLTINKGDLASVQTYFVHRGPEFQDPWRFNPYRDPSEGAGARMPFSRGKNPCLGQHLALANTTATLARIIDRLDVRLVGDEPGFVQNTLIRPDRAVALTCAPAPYQEPVFSMEAHGS